MAQPVPIDRYLVAISVGWAALAIWPGASEPCKVAGVALMAALLAVRARSGLSRPAFAALAGWTLATLLSAAVALEPALAVVGSQARAQGALIALALATLAWGASGLSRGDRQSLYRLTSVLGALLASYALLQRAGVDPLSWTNQVPGRPAATLSNATSLAGWLVLVLPVTVGAGMAGAARRPVWLALAGLQLAGLLASGSRSALLALIVATAALWLLHAPRRRQWALPIVLGGLALGLALAALRPASLQDRAHLWGSAGSALISPAPLIDLFGDADPRQPLRPWLGYGPDQQQAPLAAARGLADGRPAAAGWDADRAHQWLLDRALETGVLGVGSALWLLLTIARSLRHAAAGANPEDRREAICLALALGAWLLHLQAGFALAGDRTLAWVWIGLALGLGTRSIAIARLHPATARGARWPRLGVAALLLIGALAAGGLLPGAALQHLAPALAAEQEFVDGQQRYARALAAEPDASARQMQASAQAFERALALRRFDRDAALAAGSAWVEAAANGAGPASLQRAQLWLDRLRAVGTEERRLAPLRARIAVVQATSGD